jgi:hypothetical protein
MSNLSTGGRYALRVLAAVFLAMGALSLAATGASAELGNGPDVEPEFNEQVSNQTCAELAGEGQTWSEIKVDPNADGTYDNGETGDDRVAVEITNTADDKTFDWELVDGADLVGGIDAVYVKAGNAGSNLYRYDPPSEALADDGLTSPGASGNQISHISFCYDVGGGPTTTEEVTTTTEEVTTTTEEVTTTTEEVTTTTAGETQSSVAERTEVAGVQITQPAPAVQSTQLAATGFREWLAPFGVGLIAMGILFLRVSRRPAVKVIAR